MCSLTSSSSRVAPHPSIAFDFLSHPSVSCSYSQWPWPDSVMTRSLVRLVAGITSSVATEPPFLPALQPSAGNPPTHGDDAIRRRIRQHRYGFSYARSATMMDDTLTAISHDPIKMVTKSTASTPGKSGHHIVPGKNQDVSGVVHSTRLCASCQHASSKEKDNNLFRKRSRAGVMSWARFAQRDERESTRVSRTCNVKQMHKRACITIDTENFKTPRNMCREL